MSSLVLDPVQTRVGTLVSLNVGMPKDVPWNGSTVHTGIFKSQVDGRRMVRRLNIDGDGQGDLNGHGGEQRAVLVYQTSSYHHWADHLNRTDLGPGAFGENFTVDGLDDSEVCIGDRYSIGEAEFEVTQPRVTCFRVGMRLRETRMPALLVSHHRPGFYLRVIREGIVGAGDAIVKTRSGPQQLSVADTDALLYLPDRDHDLLERAVRIPALSPGWQQSFRELLDDAHAPMPATGVEPAWDGFRTMRVSDIRRETPTIRSFYLTARDDVPLPDVKPGQYITIRVTGAGSPPPVRSYSLSGVIDETTWRISVKADGATSRYLHEHQEIGSEIDVAAPRGEFVLQDDLAPILLLSAGVGATPVLAMFAWLAQRNREREVWWVHAAHSFEDVPFEREVRSLLDRSPRAHARVFLSAPAPGGRAGSATYVSGRIDEERLRAMQLPEGTVAYLCGPSAFTAQATQWLTSIGLDPVGIHSELFGTLAPINPGVADRVIRAPHAPAGPVGTGPAVTFARSGLTVPWRDSDNSILELAEACDVPTRWSCRTGVCHTCITALMNGSVRYEPRPLEDPPRGEVLVCCSRPATDVVVDL